MKSRRQNINTIYAALLRLGRNFSLALGTPRMHRVLTALSPWDAVNVVATRRKQNGFWAFVKMPAILLLLPVMGASRKYHATRRIRVSLLKTTLRRGILLLLPVMGASRKYDATRRIRVSLLKATLRRGVTHTASVARCTTDSPWQAQRITTVQQP